MGLLLGRFCRCISINIILLGMQKSLFLLILQVAWSAVKSTSSLIGISGIPSATTLLTGVAANVIIQRIIYEEARYLCYIPCV